LITSHCVSIVEQLSLQKLTRFLVTFSI